MNLLGRLVRVRKATPLEAYNMRFEFEDGTVKELNLEPYLHGPIFDPVRKDPDFFRRVKIEGGTIVWPNGADIDPDVLYYGLKPAWMEKPEQSRDFSRGLRVIRKLPPPPPWDRGLPARPFRPNAYHLEISHSSTRASHQLSPIPPPRVPASPTLRVPPPWDPGHLARSQAERSSAIHQAERNSALHISVH